MTRHFANLVPDESVSIQMRLSWSTNNADNYVTEFQNMAFVQNVVLDSGSPFHGAPAAGSVTVDVWRLDWAQPSSGGVPYTNAINVYYSPLLKTAAGSAGYQTDYAYLLRVGTAGATTNAFPVQPQISGPSVVGGDFLYVNQFTLNIDSDGDGLTDAEELLLGTLVNDPDSDDDGQSDGDEVVAGTLPLDGTSYFKFAATAVAPSALRLDWTAVTSRTYTVEQALGTYADGAVFLPYYTGITVAANGVLSTNLTPASSNAVYRLRVTKP